MQKQEQCVLHRDKRQTAKTAISRWSVHLIRMHRPVYRSPTLQALNVRGWKTSKCDVTVVQSARYRRLLYWSVRPLDGSVLTVYSA